jgi:hypothetical protein
MTLLLPLGALGSGNIAVLIPELIAKHSYEHFLHNKRAAM